MENIKISQLMKNLNAEALDIARHKIASRFIDPSDLEEISSVLAMNQKELGLAESQLTVAVQGKLDALKRAADLMDDSSEKLSNLSNSIRKIDEKIALTNTVISKFEHLCRVHFVRDNIRKVVSQVEFFVQVPEKVKGLDFLLQKDNSHLKEVYLETIQLEALRTALMKEIKLSSQRHAKNRKNVHVKGSRSRSSTDFSREEYQYKKMTDLVAEHLRIVPMLLQDIKDKLMKNLEDIFILGPEEPQVVVSSFEIIEMHDEYLARRINQMEKKKELGQEEDEDEEEDAIYHEQPLSEQAMQQIREALKKKALNRFNEAIQQSLEKATEAEEDSHVESTLSAASQLIALMMEFQIEVLPCVPPKYQVMNEFFDICEEYLKNTLDGLVSRGIQDLEVSDIMHVIDWVEYFKAQMRSFGAADRPAVAEFAQIAEDVMSEYLERIKSQVLEWFGNIRSQPLDVLRSDGKLITSRPEDMFHVLHLQISVAQERLPPELIREVVNACVQVLRAVQREAYDRLSADWRGMSVEAICAAINDNHRMQAKTEEFRETVLPLYQNEEDKDLASEMLDQVGNEYITLAVSSVTFLVRSILIDLDEPVFSKLFTPEWEGGTPLSPVVAATLEDYTADLRGWLEPYFIGKYLRELLVLLVGSYAMALRRHANGAFHFGNEMSVTKIILQDRGVFEKFFNQYAEFIPPVASSTSSSSATSGTGKGSLIDSELRLLKNLSVVVASTHCSAVESDIKAIFQKWGGDGQRLVQCVFMSHPSLSKNEKTAQVELANQIFEEGKYNPSLSDLFKTQNDVSLQSAIAARLASNQSSQNKKGVLDAKGVKSTAKRIFGF